MASTQRSASHQSVAILTTSSSPEIDIAKYSSGQVSVLTGETVVTLTYYIASPSGTYYAAYDASWSAITQTVAADKSYPIPSALFGAAKIQIRGNVAGNLSIDLKS